ncbi:MAG: FG-GAP-like repeat-containing protein [Gemmataceae bacterium]|nr:FG-GAP-like repeat-containing protein [Gemmataceae bacterium]
MLRRLSFVPRLVAFEDRLAPASTLISANLAGTDAGNGRSVGLTVEDESRDSTRQLSADGRYVVFVSNATNLTAEPDAETLANDDVFVRDRQTGTTTLVSVNVSGRQAGGVSDPSITPDGRYVLFTAGAPTGPKALAPGAAFAPNVGGNGPQLYVRDLQAKTTTLVTVRPDGLGSIGSGTEPLGYRASISADGSKVAFAYDGHDDEAAGDSNGLTDVAVRDLKAGTTTLVSRNLAGTNGGNGRSYSPVLSDDGTRVTFLSEATDLTALPDANKQDDLFTYSFADKTVRLISTNQAGTAASDNGVDGIYRADAAGTTVAFLSRATDLAPGTGYSFFSIQAFARNVAAGPTVLLSHGADGNPVRQGIDRGLGLSRDGTTAVFHARVPGLAPEAGGGPAQVYLVDTVTARVTLATRTADGTAGNSDSFRATPSADGRYVLFSSTATNLTPGVTVGEDGGGTPQTLYVYDRRANAVLPVSTNAAGTTTIPDTATFNNFYAISRDGSTAAFTTTFNGYGPADTNADYDVYAATVPVLAPLAPTAAVAPAAGQADPAAAGPVRFTVTFNQPVTGFDATRIDLSGSTAGGKLAAAVTGGSQVFTVSVTGMTTTGDVVLTVPAGAATTANGPTPAAGGPNRVRFDNGVPGNAPPTISGIGDLTTAAGAAAAATLTITDETPGTVTLAATSGNLALVPAAGLAFTGTGPTRTLTITPAAGQSGTATITVTPTDAQGLAGPPRSFTVTVTPAAAGGRAVLVGSPQFAAGADRGGSGATLFNPDKSVRYAIDPFGGFAGGVRTAAGDFNGDGVADLVVGTGPGRATRVVVLDGKDQRELFAVDPFEATFTGGVYVAAGDVTGDGIADLVITPDEGGGPRCRVFNGKDFSTLADFFGIDDPSFRGGARAAVGDVDGDGFGDLVVAAGFQGGPRVAGFSGKSLAAGNRVNVFPDFFAFEQTLRNGVFVTAGDLDGDGKAEVIPGGGPGGGPRVQAFSGADLLGGQFTPVANFFAGDASNRGGIRVAVKDLDGDARADLVTGPGSGGGSRVTAYRGSGIPRDGTPPELFSLDLPPTARGGVFVG